MSPLISCWVECPGYSAARMTRKSARLPDLLEVAPVDQHLHPLAGLELDAPARLVEPRSGLAGPHRQRPHDLIAVIGHFQPVVGNGAAHVGRIGRGEEISARAAEAV